MDPNTFGAPRTGVHRYRLFDIAIVDVAGTIALAWAVSHVTHFSFTKTMLVLFLMGIVFHRIVGVHTKIDTLLFR